MDSDRGMVDWMMDIEFPQLASKKRRQKWSSMLVVCIFSISYAWLPALCQADPFADSTGASDVDSDDDEGERKSGGTKADSKPIENYDDAVEAESALIREERKGPEALWRTVSELCTKSHVAITSGHLNLAEKYAMSALNKAMAYEPTVFGKEQSKRYFYIARPFKLIGRIVEQYIKKGNYEAGNRLGQTFVRTAVHLEGNESVDAVRSYVTVGQCFSQAKQWQYSLFYFANALDLTKNLSSSKHMDTPSYISEEYVKALMHLGRKDEARKIGQEYGVRPDLYLGAGSQQGRRHR